MTDGFQEPGPKLELAVPRLTKSMIRVQKHQENALNESTELESRLTRRLWAEKRKRERDTEAGWFSPGCEKVLCSRHQSGLSTQNSLKPYRKFFYCKSLGMSIYCIT